VSSLRSLTSVELELGGSLPKVDDSTRRADSLSALLSPCPLCLLYVSLWLTIEVTKKARRSQSRSNVQFLGNLAVS